MNVGAEASLKDREFAPEDMDRAYANGDFIPGSAALPAEWAARAAAFRAGLGGRALLDQPYGEGARQRFDLFLPEAPPRGLLVFVHGGYWMQTGRADWSHLAAGALARGWACALPGYTLAPEARIATITAEVARAVRAARKALAGDLPMVVTGHSAGGHLAARMAVLGAPGLVRAVPISPVAELTPLLRHSMNAVLQLDGAEALAESPARQRPRVPAHVWVGAQERPAFLWQARLLAEEWDCPWTPEPGRHHFDVIEGLCTPNSPLLAACLDGL